jgi:outer membrane protein assembly complex protein YaeT
MEGVFEMSAGARIVLRGCRCVIAALIASIAASSFGAGGQDTNAPASIKISGYGLLGNRQLKRILRTVELGGKKPTMLGPSFVEDSALILGARIKSDGYLKPRITIRLVTGDGRKQRFEADGLLENPLPRPLAIKTVEFQIHKGRLYHYQELSFDGLTAVPAKRAKSFFMETGTLFHPKGARVFTQEKLERGVANLTALLDRMGYRDAAFKVAENNQDEKTGAVIVRLAVAEGKKSIVTKVHEQFLFDGEAKPRHIQVVHTNHAFSKVWVQDYKQHLKTNLFHQGYPDVSVDLKPIQSEETNGVVWVELSAVVRSGVELRIGKVGFSGEKRTKASVMSRRVKVKSGELLDPVRIEEGRYKLARMGSFDAVDVSYTNETDHVRDVMYDVKEGKHLDVSLLFGYGSYELLRGGVEVQENNIWGLGHNARLKAVQSFKASSGEFFYTVPEYANDVDLFLNSSGLRREEVSFTRLEYGGGFGGHKFYTDYATDMSVRYSYQILNASEVPGIVAAAGTTNTAVGSIIMDVKHDRRDNPLYPRSGYRVFGNLELASEYLGGEANYERLELWTSWHHPLGGGRYLGLGLSHGVVLSVGSPSRDLPFNRRFFPGGENSIRGYSEGEASPRDAQGKIIGSETYTLGTVELEQALTAQWSFVLFSDSLGFAASAANYPFDTGLFSVGGGLRWKTLIGPVRFEYGQNLNPRPRDPSGTFQFSLGFPF